MGREKVLQVPEKRFLPQWQSRYPSTLQSIENILEKQGVSNRKVKRIRRDEGNIFRALLQFLTKQNL